MRRNIHVAASTIATIGFLALGLYLGYERMTQNKSFPGIERIFGLTAMCASVIAFATQRWAMNPAMRQTLVRIMAIVIGTGVLAGVGILVVILAGPESAVGRAAIYATLAIAALGAGFGMAYGYSLPWLRVEKRGSTPTEMPTGHPNQS